MTSFPSRARHPLKALIAWWERRDDQAQASLLFRYVREYEVEEVRRLSKRTSILGWRRSDGDTVLHLLVSSKVLENTRSTSSLSPVSLDDRAVCADILIKAGAPLNKQNILGDTALHDAVFMGDMSYAKQLVKAGARMDLVNNKGQTPFDLMEQTYQASAGKVLLDAGAKASRQMFNIVTDPWILGLLRSYEERDALQEMPINASNHAPKRL